MLNVLLPFVIFNVHFMLIVSVAGLASRRISPKPCEVHGGGPFPHSLCFTVPVCNVGEFVCVLLFSSSFCHGPEQLLSPAQPFSCFYLIIGQIYS